MLYLYLYARLIQLRLHGEVCNMAIQIYGGSGACKEYPVEQLLRDVKRDVKISTIYEGTTGIQAIDMLSRKLGMKKGKVFKTFIGKIKKVIEKAQDKKDTKNLALEFEKVISRFENTSLKPGQAAKSDKLLEAFSFTCPFVEVFGEYALSVDIMEASFGGK